MTAGQREPFVELVAATNFSFLRGASHPAEMVRTAAGLGYRALGIADRNSLAGIVRAHVACKAEGVRLCVGVRLVLVDGFEVAAYPTNRAAYGRLCRLLSTGNRRARKGECHLTFEEVCQAQDGQIFIVLPHDRPCAEGEHDAFTRRIAVLSGLARGRVYLGASLHLCGDARRRLGALARLAEETGAPLVATNDPLYHDPSRRPLADVLTAIRDGVTVETAGFRLAPNGERYLKSAAEVARLFADAPEALARSGAIAQRLAFSLDELRYEYPDEPVPPGKTPQGHLEDLVWSQAAERFPDGIPDKIESLLRKELALIADLDYARYFLTVHDVVHYARSQDILCQGRGSAANSAVCYCLGITAIDPMLINALFERFISAERREPPDIDVDFEHERREEVIQYLYGRYGRERAAICSTVIHYRPRLAIREVGKALGLKEDITAALADTVWGSFGTTIPDRDITDAGLDPKNPVIGQLIGLAGTLIGFPRHLSQHVGGFVLTRGRLDESVPILNGAIADRTFIEWDKDDIDALGMMKVDVLALGMLTAIRKSFDLIARHKGLNLTLATVPQEDPAVYEMLSEADSIGVFQVESRAQMSMLPRLKPAKFYDLVIEVAIVRPGPIQGDMVHPYLRRRQGLEPTTYPSPELEAVLEKTCGVPLFQEQAMQIAIVAAGFTPGEADKLRRAMATFRNVGTIHTFREKFITGMIANGYAPEFATRCFAQIEGFGEYGFPESHAASFALLVYVSAWIKRHHPEVFCAALLNSQPMGFYQPAQLVRDARQHGVTVRAPDVGASDWDCTLEEAEEPGQGHLALRLGLRLVSGLAKAAADAVVAMRGEGYRDMAAIARRSGMPAAALERLADADAFRSLGLDRRAALWAVKGLDGATPAGHGARDVQTAGRRRAGRKEGAATLLAEGLTADLFAEPEVALAATRLGEHVSADYATIGLSLKAHPCALLRARLDRRRVLTSAAHREPTCAGRRVRIAGLVLVRQRPGTAKGVIFLTLEDETGVVNVIVWPKVFEANRRAVMTARLLLVEGRVQREGLVIHVTAERLVDLTAELSLLTSGSSELSDSVERAPAGTGAWPKPRPDPGMDPEIAAVAAAKRPGRRFRSRDFH